jgi:hypothetical protein
MLTDRHSFWAPLLTIAVAAAGLVLLERSILLIQGGSFVRLAGLLLILYGAVLAWWRFEAAALALHARVAQIVRRVR